MKLTQLVKKQLVVMIVHINYEIARTKNLSKELTLGNLEEIIKELFSEIQLAYDQPEQLTAKIVIRAKKEKNKIMYLG